MKAKFLAAILILSGLFVTYEVSYAGCGTPGGPSNQSPVAILTAEPEHVAVDCNVTLDGNDSYDPDGYITKYEWDFTNDGTYDYNETSSYPPDGIFDGNTVHDYNTPGTYTVKLRVTDDDDATDTDTCVVHVVGINNTNKGTWYVTIQAAINDANNGDEIVVYPDTYYENIDFSGKKITLTSTDPNDWDVVSATIIDANDPNASIVTFETSEDANSVLRGFTITGGARGIYCYSASPTIRDCVIIENGSGGNDGGGMYTYNSSVVVMNCFIRENDANCGGGMYNIDSSPTVANCVFGENDANSGGGVYNSSSSPTMINCTFSDNSADYGGGMYNYGASSEPNVTNCIFLGNDANCGGGMYNINSSPTVANCVFGENDANSGGGMYDYNSSPSVVNCTFSGNYADSNGGGMYNYGASSEPNVTNCIFWGNDANDYGDEIYNAAFADPNFSYCDINGCGGSDNWDPNFGTDGGGNIDEDPLFWLPTYPPVSHWKFDEGSGTTASDSSGNGNDGTLNGDTSWAAGKVGSYALNFDGDGDYVEIADDDSLTPGSQITIAFWIYNRGGQNAGIYKYASCPSDPGSPGNSRAYTMPILDSSLKLSLQIFATVDDQDHIETNGTVPLNQWHHVAGTFNQGEAVVYIDGQLDNSGTLSVSSIMNDAQPLIIGGCWEYCGEDSFENSLNGLADDVRIYDRALSAFEIQQLYLNGWDFYFCFYHLSPDSPCINGGDPNGSYDGQTDIDGEPRVMGTRVDMGADEVMIWYVDDDANAGGDGTSWNDAFDDLQEALDVAIAGDGIWVAEGTYEPDVSDPNNRAISFELVEGVAVYGGFDGNEIALEDRVWVAHPTILSGDINQPGVSEDNSYHVVVSTDGAILDGFIITGGNADGSDANEDGGGIYCDQSSFTIRRCIISDNTAQDDGGGIYCEDSNPILTNCVIVENEAGDDGGGIYDCNSSPRLINCTFSGNYADNNGGGMYSYGAYSDPNVTNCIFWGNTASSDGNEIYNTSSADPNFSYCDIAGSGGSGPNDWDPNFGSDDGGNIDSEPNFVDPNDPDGPDDSFYTLDDGLRLDPNSPCVDAADGDAAPETDILGLGRVDVVDVNNKGRGEPNYADIGAYEFSYIGLDGSTIIGTGTGSWTYPIRTYCVWESDPYDASRTQVIYTTEELGGPKTFTSLALYVTDLPGEILDNWTIRMKHTSIDDYNDSSNRYWHGDGWTVVYQNGENISSIGWATFVFDTPFEYNGTDNLMVDFSHNNSCYEYYNGAACRFTYDDDDYRNIYCSVDDSEGYGDPLTWELTSPSPDISKNAPNIWLVSEYPRIAVTPAEDFIVTGPNNGPFEPSQKIYTLRNIGINPLNFSVTKQDPNQNWYDINGASSTTGSLMPNRTKTIKVSLNDNADNLPRADYSDSIIFADLTNGTTCIRNISLYMNNYVSITGNDETGDGSSGNPYRTIQKGIDVTSNGGKVVVMSNEVNNYVENIDFKGKAITLTSTNPDDPNIVSTTVIDGNDANDVVTFKNCENANSVITGFTITNASSYAGVLCDYASPTITNCTISDNKYGVHCEQYSSPDISDCNISDSSLYGVHCMSYSSANITGCSINSSVVRASNNSSLNISNCNINPGLVEASSSSLNITDCNINSGLVDVGSSSLNINNCNINSGGVYAENNSSLNISDCNISSTSNAIYGFSSLLDISDCTISGPGQADGIAFSGSLHIKNCTITNYRRGICVNDQSTSSGSQATITNCIISNNTKRGINCGYNSSATISNCTIVDNHRVDGRKAYGILGEASSGKYAVIEVKNCILWDNDDDLYGHGCFSTYSCIEDGDLGIGNFSRDPMFVDADFHLQGGTSWPWSPCIDAGDPSSDYSNEPSPNGGRINMGAYGNTEEAATVTLVDSDGDGLPDQWEIYYLPGDDPSQHDPNDDTDGDGLKNIVEYQIGWDPNTDNTNSIPGYVWNERTGLKYPSIQWAIDNASDGDTLIVGPGRYYEAIHFIGRKITISSTEPNNPRIVNATIIDGNGIDDDGEVVMFSYSEDANSVLRGFTITGGGRGIYCSGASPTIANCIITDNTVDGDGAGICCTNSSSPTIIDCILSDNCASIYNPEGDPNGYGGGISQGHGGGISCEDSDPTITNCFIIENSAACEGGGIYCKNSYPTVINCVICKNEGGYQNGGGGIYNYNCSPILINCTFSGNSANKGGGLSNYGASSEPNVTNCIFWGNNADNDGNEIYNYNGADPNFSYCDIAGCGGSGPNDWDPNFGSDDFGNIDSEPNFADANVPAGLDGVFGTWDDGLRVLAYSPCVDAADGNAAPLADISGQTRIDVPYVDNNKGTGEPNYADIGAYESPTVWFVDANAAGGNGTSWDDAFIDLQDALAEANDGDQIWVAEGIYKPDTNDPNNRSISFALVEGVELYGGFANTSRHQRGWAVHDLLIHETILSGDINELNDPSDNSYHVVIGADRALLEGFTITGGNADGSGVDNNGGGIYCDGIDTTIRKCIIFENWAYADGGGVYCNDSNLAVTNCIISENLAPNGGGMFNNNSDATVTNCTFTGNVAEYGGGIYDSNSNIEVKNSIVWYNFVTTSGDNIYNNSSDPNISYCNIGGCKDSNGIWDPNFGTDGGGNINVVPNFKDVTNPVGPDGVFGTWDDGLRLMGNSPCIDAANGNTAPFTDILNFIRFDVIAVDNTGSGIPDYADMGVCESYSGLDIDGDGMQDDWEILYGLDPANPDDADVDTDDDGYINLWEYLNGGNPIDPNNFPNFNPEPLPYQTSFEMGEGFDGGYPDGNYVDIDGQKNWNVFEGTGHVYCWRYDPCDPNYFYQYAISYGHYTLGYSTVCGFFDDSGSDHKYIRLRVWPLVAWVGPDDYWCNSEVSIKYGDDVLGAVRFGSSPNYYIYVWDGSGWSNSGASWFYTWKQLMFDMDYHNNTYKVFYGGSLIADANFSADCDRLTTIELKGGEQALVVDSISINDEPTNGGTEDDYDITNPRADKTDKLEGRVEVKGSAWWNHLTKYDIMFCPADPDINEFDLSNWHVADSCYSTGVKDGFLGYWDTSSIPNGYYYLGILPYWDVFHEEDGPIPYSTLPFVVEIELRYPNEEPVYSGPKYFAIVGDLKCNTFYHEEEPDISVPWPGQFPFELRRTYNNNRRFYNKPLRNGWTQNNQIVLIEDSTYDWEKIDSGGWEGYPAYDNHMVAFGYIWVRHPDGSRKMFKHTDGRHGEEYWGEAIYHPYPENNTGEYIVRTTTVHDEAPYRYIDKVQYELYTRNGTVFTFDTGDLVDVKYMYSLYYGTPWGRVVAPLDTMSDKFGNTLSFSWEEISDTAVWNWVSPVTTRIRYDRQDGNEIGIILELDDNDNYAKAELRAGTDVYSSDPNDYDVYRTVNYEWDDVNDIFRVIKTGTGVDANGVYDPCDTKEYVTQYQYEYIDGSGLNLIKIAYDDDINKPSIEVEHGDYGRVSLRKDYADPNNYLPIDFDYTFYHPDPNNKKISYLQTDANAPHRLVTTIQDEKGNAIEQYTVTSDGSAVTDVNSFYEDEDNRRKPTDIYEYFDDVVRRTWNDYSAAGDLLEQRVYIDDVNYVCTEMTYHTAVWTEGSYEYPLCVLKDSKTSYQNPNKSGQKVQTLYIYGDANGTPDPNEGVYLVKEKVLLSEDPNVWAETTYKYDPNTGLAIEKVDPNGFITFYEYDDNGYKKLIKAGTADYNEPVRRFYHDAIGQLWLKANHLGGVTLNDYDDFGRLYKVRTYDYPGALTIPDANFVPDDYNDMEPDSTTIYGYDERGNRTYEKRPAGGEVVTDYTISGPVKRTTYTYDANSYVGYTYDSRGLKTQEYRYDAISDVNWYVEFDYDSMDRPNDICWYDYDDTTIVKRKSSEYWGSGKKQYDKLYGYNDVLEKQTNYYYDILGRITSFVVAPGELDLTTAYNYDAAGNRTSIIDPNGSCLYFDYDSANRRIAEYFAAAPGTEPSQATVKKQIRYYENNLIRDVNSYDYDDTLLARSEFEYDARRRVTKVTQQIDDVNQAVTVYDYNDSGFDVNGLYYQIRITDANDKETHIALDAFGGRIETLYPSNDYEQLEYNGDGTLKRKAVFEPNDTKRWIEYYYDGYSRLTDVNYPDTGNINHSYDGFGRKVLTTDNRNADDNIGGDGQIAYEYDVLGRIINVTDQNDYEISHTYQADGQKESIKVYSPSLIYEVECGYDAAGRLANVYEPLLGANDYIAEFEYDDNGNRTKLTYRLDGTSDGNSTSLDYAYNRDNLLTGYSSSSEGVTGPTFTLSDVNVDGLGRLTDANETITKTDGNTLDHRCIYRYDMLSQLTDANISNIGGTNKVFQYIYKKNGDMVSRKVQSNTTTYSYNGHLMIEADSSQLDWDLNGSLTTSLVADLLYNWDNKLQLAQHRSSSDSIALKYEPLGNRIWRQSTVSGQTTTRSYVVDIVGDLPVILLELDPDDNMSIKKTYIYANSQIIAQHNGDHNADRYFYLHDRLGSVRQIIDTNGGVFNRYTFRPFGRSYFAEKQETITNPFWFTGQYYDKEIKEYYLRARQYEPRINRFASRDPVKGKFKQPLSLHKYLYCQNEPINRLDRNGLWLESIHRSFGNYGWGYDSQRGHSLFDYARLDFDRPATNPWHLHDWRPLHFKSKKEAGKDILTAIGEGDVRGFEYAMHGFQDTYTHYDRGFTWMHLDVPSIDDLDWSNPSDVAAYRACDKMTRFFEGLFIKSNIDIWMAHPEVDLPTSNPWLSVFDSWSSPSSRAGSYLAPIYKQQMKGY